MPDKIFIKSLRPIEYQSLSKAYNSYMENCHSCKGGLHNIEFELTQLSILWAVFGPIFNRNPAIKELAEKSTKKELQGLSTEERVFNIKFSNDDVSKVRRLCDLDDYDQMRTQEKLGRIKARFLIFCFEIEGFYKRPKELDANHLYEAVMSNCFYKEEKNSAINEDSLITPPGCFTEDQMNNLVGTYQVFRLSFNNSFEGNVASYTLRVDRDYKDRSVLSYSTFNTYSQYQPSSANRDLVRIRRSTGHLYNYQSQILFLGGVSYTHMEEYENESAKTNYPEIFLMHSHSGDTKNCRGIILAHFPYLSLPVATSIYICKLSDETMKDVEDIQTKISKAESLGDSKKLVLTENEEMMIASHYGNINPDSEESNTEIIDQIIGNSTDDEKKKLLIAKKKGVVALYKEVSKVNKYIRNQIETKYTNMLTP